MLLTGFYTTGSATHASNYLIESGWDISVAGAILSITSFSGMLGNFFGGMIVNKIGILRSVTMGGILVLIAMISLFFARTHMTAAILYAVFIGLAVIMGSLIPSLVVSRIFGYRDYAGIYGFINIFYMLGSALSSVIVACIASVAGYPVVWLTICIIIVVIILLYMCCLKVQNKQDISDQPCLSGETVK